MAQPRDLFAERGINVDQPRDLFAEKGINPVAPPSQNTHQGYQLTWGDDDNTQPETTQAAPAVTQSPVSTPPAPAAPPAPVQQPMSEHDKQMALLKQFALPTDPLSQMRSFLYGGGNTMAHLAQMVNPSQPGMPDIRSQNPSPIAEGVGSYLPYALGGGASLAGSTAAAGAYGLTQFDNGQSGVIDNALGISPSGDQVNNRLRSSLEDMAINALTHGLITPFMKKPQTPQANFSPPPAAFAQGGESEFNNIPYTQPRTLSQGPPPPLSENIAAGLHQNIGLGKTPEQAGKDLATMTSGTYNAIRNAHEQRYNNLFNTPTDDINHFTDKPILVKDTRLADSEYKKNFKDTSFPDSNIQELHEKFIEDPTIDNAHKLQSELGSEVGYLKSQKLKGNLDGQGKNTLRSYAKARSMLKGDMSSTFKAIDPKLDKEYNLITEDWKNNVEPFHIDKNLKSIAQGQTKNPTSAEITSIFKNPEEHMDKVVSSLPDGAKDKIAYIGMGKQPYQNTPKDVISGMTSLDRKGLGSYVRPQHQEYLANLKSNVSSEKEAQDQYQLRQQLAGQIKEAQDKVNQLRMKSNANALANMEKRTNEANALVKQKQKEYQTLAEDLAQKKYQKKLDRINALRSLVGGGIGAGIVHALNISPEDMLGSYLGKTLLKKAKGH